MAVAQTFTFGSASSSTYGVVVEGPGDYTAAKRDVEMVSIPGRSGDLEIDMGRYENIEVEYKVAIKATTQSAFETSVSSFKNAIVGQRGYKKLTDSYHSGEYRMARYAGGLDEEPEWHGQGAVFKVKFDCKPQRFLDTGDTVTTMTASGSISNPTNFDSKPLLVVTGTGTLTVNGVQITFTASPTTVDCEAMEAYNGTTSRNGSITLSPNRFPVLSPGSNTITKGSGISQVKITPRWWRV